VEVKKPNYSTPCPLVTHLRCPEVEILTRLVSIAVDFLTRNGFNFDLLYTHGIPYLSRRDEHDVRTAWLSRGLEKAALSDMPIKEEDTVLIDHVRASIKQWREEPAVSRENYLNIPNTSEGGVRYMAASQNLNRYQIRLVHQIVRNEYPKLKTAGKGHFVQITPLDNKREISERLQQARYRDRDISRAIEFRWLIEAISGGDITKMPPEYFTNAFSSNVEPPEDEEGALKFFICDLQQKLSSRRRVLIGHNCFTDLVYLYSCFVGQLPDRLEDFQDLIRGMFPAVIDTKFMASFGKGWHSTSLQDVESELEPEGPGVPMVEVPIEFDRYAVGQRLHEAGYDSLLTAKIAIKLSAKLEKEAKFPAYQEQNALKLENATDDDVSEHYSTAPESNADSEAGGLAATVKNVLSTPVTAIGNFFRSDLASTGHQFTENQDQGISDKLEDLLVFSEKGDEEEEQQRAIGQSSQLNWETSKLWEDVDKPSAPSSNSQIDKPLTKAECFRKVERGQLMPRWEGGRGFWQYFGKKLQVNSAEEGICYL
jgi:poly(A)-specific ribonuclease